MEKNNKKNQKSVKKNKIIINKNVQKNIIRVLLESDL